MIDYFFYILNNFRLSILSGAWRKFERRATDETVEQGILEDGVGSDWIRMVNNVT